jgi:hypothetical protein
MPEDNKFQPSLPQAMAEMTLTPQEQFLYNYHLKNLTGGGGVWHPEGGVSTIYQMPVEGPGGKFYNIPTVWEGQILKPEEAIKRAATVGWDKWPSYDTEEHAEVRYQRMHKYMDTDFQSFMKSQNYM